MTVCNSCRYCEGLCAVFPAMEMRRAFPGRRSQLSRQPLPRLRRLLRRLPVLAAARVRRQRAARARAGARRVLRGLRVAARARAAVRAQRAGDQPRGGACRRGVHRRLCRPGTTVRAVRHAHRAGRVLPTDAACRDGVAVRAAFLYAIVAIAMGVRAFWRDIGDPVAVEWRLALAGDRAMPQRCAISMAAASAATTTTNGRTTAAGSIIT